MNKKKTITCFLSVLTIAMVVVVCFRVFAGYYPLPEIVYRLYYANQHDGERLDNIKIDGDFRFHERGYSVSREISSPYPLPHFLILQFDSGIAPISIETKISLKIEVFRKNKLVYSTVTKNGDTLFKRDKKRNLLAVQSINILELPFPLKWKAYKDIRFEVTVIEADEELHKYIDKAALFLFPDIRVDSPEV